jgi:2-C-methyl-D-erythritol 2,4-cyclodiphosphate synthase/2-C-methyl-D-erythritol 4-phosphate cytidylyltransferase
MRPPRIAVIVVAAGEGTRLGAGTPKAFVPLGGRPMLEHALHSVLGMREPAQLIVVVPGGLLDEARQIATRTAGVVAELVTVVAGGESRQASVHAGLSAVLASVDVVLVHDAARALTPSTQFDRVVAAVDATDRGAVPGLPVADTIKRMDAGGTILGTVDRSELSAVQTPQGFPRTQLDDAYAAQPDDFTDDAALVAAVGHPVGLVEGDPLAFKITTAWDLQRAEQLLAPAAGARVGVGVDTHAFGGDGGLWVAGLHWPGEPGLLGHSDADPVAHAIADALLSAAALGDLGSAFGTSDPRYAGAHGDVFVREAVRMLREAGFVIGNVSVQLIGNRPRFSARRAEAEELLTHLVGAPVSIAATTTDGLGFTGRGEGLAAIATALVARAR